MTMAITDFTQYAGLRAGAQNNDPEVLREVAGQFEALFIQTILKNMREASLGDPMFGDSEQHKMYEEMLDQQMAVEMASGKGIGLADMLVRQLGGESTARQPVTTEFRLDTTAGTAREYRIDSAAGTAKEYRLDAPEKTDLRTDASARTATVKTQPNWSDPDAFARDVWPHAERAARKLNVAPEAILAQAALETGWGAHVPHRPDGNSSFNVFGIKASGGWSGDSVAKTTLEFEAGVARLEAAKFRAYDGVAENFDDYSEMLSGNPRYETVSNHGEDVDGFARALQSSGYATDPSYADKIKRVVNGETMQRILGGLKTLATPPIAGRLAAGSD